MAVYLIGPKSGPFKIGFSKDVAQRLAELQTACPWRLGLHAVRDDWTKRDEVRLHEEFSAHRAVGEWFDCSLDLLLRAFGVSRDDVLDGGMAPEEFVSWLAIMKRLPPHDDEDSCRRLLGITERQLTEAKVIGGPRMLALACRALLHRLEPYG